MKKVAALSIAILSFSARPAVAHVLLDLGTREAAAGDTIRALGVAEPIPGAERVDVYVLARTPAGKLYSFTQDGAVSSRIRVYAGGARIPPGGWKGVLFTHRITPRLREGTYTVGCLLMPPGERPNLAKALARDVKEILIGPPWADLVVSGATIFTSDALNPHAQALAVRGGRIRYVGDEKGVTGFIGPGTRVIQAKGRFLTPCFGDSHCHPLWIGGIGYLMPSNLFACATMDDIAAAVRAHAAANPGLPFVGGIGWRMDQVPGGVPRKEILDGIVTDRPVVLMSYSGQAGWLNSAAVRHFSGRNPEAFEALLPVRDPETGEFTGELRHFHSVNFLDYYTWEELGAMVEEGVMDEMQAVLDSAVSVGVTFLNDVQIYPQFVPLLLKFRNRGGFDRVRVRCSYYIGPERLNDPDQLERDLLWWKRTGEEESGPHLNLGESVKFYIDGTPDNRTAFLLEPYSDDPGNYGNPDWTQEDFDTVVGLVDRVGLQACTHAIGDAGIRRVVNSYERARNVNGLRDSRHRIEHCEFPAPEEIERMGRLGILAAMQPAHFFGDEMLESGLGPARIRRFVPWRSLEEAGVPLSFGSDWCNSPFNPIYGLILATTRLNYKMERDWGPEEAIPLEDGIRHWTIGSAHALFMEQETGSIEIGKHADFVLFRVVPGESAGWLDYFIRNFRVEGLTPRGLDDLVDLTVVGGAEAYRRPGAAL